MKDYIINIWFYSLKLNTKDKIEILSMFSPVEFYNFCFSDYINLGINIIIAENI
ncbi:hypothetical protein Q428_03355 [Fervidicella metallireducens AeB]|uniref:Uncharacterized protein n=1 Tax=Fervidicella metallireducens AeB TaxID=1403537 RepID=A0A017RXA4_9CLOT|nr:hypothetical protein Q428_03355 [Fervidicella metallireducens AeB]